jgi:hypothetical protein
MSLNNIALDNLASTDTAVILALAATLSINAQEMQT